MRRAGGRFGDVDRDDVGASVAVDEMAIGRVRRICVPERRGSGPAPVFREGNASSRGLKVSRTANSPGRAGGDEEYGSVLSRRKGHHNINLHLESVKEEVQEDS